MTTLVSTSQPTEIFYPSSDGEPVAETYVHLYALLVTLEVLMTSKSTQEQDQTFKKTLYEQLEVKEYWLFDPKGEWIEGRLQGYRLRGEQYEPITDRHSEPLQLRLEVDGQLIAFYREDTGEKLLVPGELAQALREESLARREAEERAEQEHQRAEEAEQQVKELKERLRALGVNPD
jgi:hypothetical protein